MNRTLKTALAGLALLGSSLIPAESAAWGGANPGRLGVGLRLGSPSGLTAKYWINDKEAMDIAVGAYGYYANNLYSGLNIHADYLWHRFGVFGDVGSDAYTHLPLYVGLGAVYSSPDVVGARAVLGITWLFEDHPFDLFFDLAPTLVVTPGMGFGIGAGMGGRYYF